jgi:hypothetical protein
MAILQKAVQRLCVIPFIIPTMFFTEKEKKSYTKDPKEQKLLCAKRGMLEVSQNLTSSIQEPE